MLLGKLLKAHWRAQAFGLACLLGVIVGLSNWGVGLDRVVSQLGWTLRDRAASGDLVIVEVDARSIETIDRWPWPRSEHARIIDRLREAGAAGISFDIDFSSKSSASDDAALAAALARAGDKVVLPTFSQPSGSRSDGWIDSLPIAELRGHAAMAAVSVRPDTDGYVRRIPIGIITGGLPRPSLSAMAAGVNGTAGEDFPIDFSIDPATIPRYSFVDIRDGHFDPKAIRGKSILIGATAIELGDRYAVPRFGVIPGVTIQGLAVETLRGGIPREPGWVLPLLIAAGLAAALLRSRTRVQLALALLAAPLVIVCGDILAESGGYAFPVAPALAVIGFAGLCAVTKRSLGALHRRKIHDAVTGLPNRHALHDALRSRTGVGVLAAHITDFEKLSAALGSVATGDLVRRVRDRVALISEGSTVYRIEDRVLAWRCYDKSELEQRLATLRTAMLNPIDVGGRRVDVRIAVGYADEIAGERADSIIAHAALAAAQALAAGNHWHSFDTADNETVHRELSLLGELDDAIERAEIEVHYQPKLSLHEDRITGFEALVRWQHPTRGFLRPDLFIPLAESNGRIGGLTLHVLRITIDDLKRWRAMGHGLVGAVNISAKLLNSKEFIGKLRKLIDVSGIDPNWLTFEVTESAAMIDPVEAARTLRHFRDMGIAISMDDYGTGQSTLSYLKQLPLNELKIDRSFVQFAHQNHGDGVLVRSTIDLAHELGLKVVAEGVEDAECLAFLKAVGCDLIQGYYISKPVPAAAMEALLAAPRSYIASADEASEGAASRAA